MRFYEKECMKDTFYFGYLTIVDFFMYELVNYIKKFDEKVMQEFPKLMQLRDRVASIQEIRNY